MPDSGLGHTEATQYCVVCVLRDDGAIRVVGPFSTQDDAVTWAKRMRGDNRAWDYTPDVLIRPTWTGLA